MIRVCFLIIFAGSSLSLASEPIDFSAQIAPLLTEKCLSCHHTGQAKGELDLTSRVSLIEGGESGLTVTPGDPQASLFIEYISGDEPLMPKGGEKLSEAEVALLTEWVKQKLPWPAELVLDPDDAKWWSLKPLVRPHFPEVANEWRSRVRNPIDAFVLAKLSEQNLSPSPEADRRTLIRRLKFDLHGLPPTPEEVEEFVNDPDPLAYEKLIDRYLTSPRYGERWARHWLDVVHYADTHGYDKDKLRPNAYHYRDYVIRSFNEDKPYARFIEEQIAGDVLFPDDPTGIIATGFIAAGPWDFISHVEVPEAKLDGQIARSLDRDDMVRTTMETFNSVTIGCARCHNHKFDPVPMEDYYSLQAVFAAVDRADREFDAEPVLHQKRQELLADQARLQAEKSQLEAEVRKLGGKQLAEIEAGIKQLSEQSKTVEKPEFGYHSQISTQQNETKWVQVDLGEPVDLSRIVIVGCHDNFNGIGAGFGFPVRYKIEACNEASFQSDVTVLVDRTGDDVPNPGVAPQEFLLEKQSARYLRVTATKLALRQNDYIFALAELQAFDADNKNVASGTAVTALDSIEAPVRWRKANLVDGYYFGVMFEGDVRQKLAELQQKRAKVMSESLSPQQIDRSNEVDASLAGIATSLSNLPSPQKVYTAATTFAPQGNHKATGGVPREIRLLKRGNMTSPGEVMSPGAIAALDHLPGRFELPPGHSEGDRRAALARWIADKENVLTWRSIVNRVWLYHFGRGIVDSPNDFGRMGQLPSHPELLGWLAIEFRDRGQSIKNLHRTICTSSTYRQVSTENPQFSEIDSGNVFLWRMNRRRLEAEEIRDAILQVSGKLAFDMYGPGFQDFVIEKPEHSPHYKYELYDPNDSKSHRRSIYRFIVRSQQQPFLTTMDCADPSMQVPKRNQTITSLQALSLLNNRFIVAMSNSFADRLENDAANIPDRMRRAVGLAFGRSPSEQEIQILTEFAAEQGLQNACRLIFNLNEFVFVD